jgi:hypothetical protein
MRIYGERRTHKFGPIRVNRAGLRPTSVTLDLGLWRVFLWKARKR